MASPRHQRRCLPAVEDLEGRQLLSAASSSNAARVNLVRHEYHVFVSNLQQLELKSKATPAEAGALRDDAREISQDASATTLPLPAAQTKALAASLQLDRAPLNGWVGDLGWEAIRVRLDDNLSGLNVPPALVDQTIADMRAIARSAGVASFEAQHLDSDSARLLNGEQYLGSNSYYDFPDPRLYYTQHLRGFFQGGSAEKVAAQAKRNSDLRQLQVAEGGNGADATVLHRDARLLEVIGATLTNDANAQFGDTFVAAFAQGDPSEQELAQLPGQLRAALGPGASRTTLANVDQLAADAPTFFRAVGSSVENVRLVVDDVQALVAAGGAAPLDPFKIQIVRTASPSSASG